MEDDADEENEDDGEEEDMAAGGFVGPRVCCRSARNMGPVTWWYYPSPERKDSLRKRRIRISASFGRKK
jgi:hypothetical protein